MRCDASPDFAGNRATTNPLRLRPMPGKELEMPTFHFFFQKALDPALASWSKMYIE
jgi:hypothetical protein